MDPEVSVVIPVYNSEKYLDKCLGSLAEQTLQDFEIIAVDDGSTDHSYRKLLEYKEMFGERLRVLQKPNGGQSSARNAALAYVAGKYVAFLDSDDFVDKEYLQKLSEEAEQYQSDMVCSGQIRICEDGKIVSRIVYPIKKDGTCVLRRLNFSGKLYRTEYLKKHNMHFAEGKIYEDNPFNMVMIFLAENFRVLPYEGYYQTVHVGSTTTRKITEEKLPFMEIENAIQYIQANSKDINDKELFEFTMLSFFTYFIFQANKRHHYLTLEDRESDIDLVMKICDYTSQILKRYFPRYYKNVYVGILKNGELCLSQRAGVWLFVLLVRTGMLKKFTKFYYCFL